MTIALDSRCRRLLVAGLATALSITGFAAANTSNDDTPKAADLPEAKAVFDNALEAMGGRETLKNIKSSMLKAKMTTPMGELTLESYFFNPNQFLLKQIIPGMGEIKMGSDGETTWVLNPMMGYQLLEDEDAEDMRGQASMHNLVTRLEKDFSDIETVERTRFHGMDCYKLRMIDKQGEEQFAYFDAESKFMAGLEMTQQTPMGSSTATMRFEKWEKRGDIKMFTRMVVNQMGMNMTMEVTEVEFDKVDKSIFTLPAEVKKLANERRPAQGDDAEKPTEEKSS